MTFNVIEGSGTGIYNGIDGATGILKFTDAGKSGKEDIGTIKIKDAMGISIESIWKSRQRKYEAINKKMMR